MIQLKKILRTLLIAISILSIAGPVGAYELDVCSNIEGNQSEVPKHYKIVNDPVSGEPICVPKNQH